VSDRLPAREIRIAADPGDPVASSPPVGWAIGQLERALAGHVRVARTDRSDAGVRPELFIVVAGSRSREASALLGGSAHRIPSAPESFALLSLGRDEDVVLASAVDARGLVYALLELVDRIEHAPDPLRAVRPERPLIERPANAVRSVIRAFCSEVEDKGWFHSHEFWRGYLTHLVSQRFNRFSLTLGLGYNFPWNVTDAYLYFAYPFLLSVPGYSVRVPQLADDERDRNLETLRFISDEAAARGLDFQLGLWTHAFEWLDSPDAHHTVQGLDPDRHGAYCRDALRALLDACPSIGGITFRTHGESGIPERSWDFWRTVLSGVVRSGRPIGIDLHAKGLDNETLEIALATGLPVTVSPKYWAEHMGLPYHQADIRDLERPRDDTGSERTAKQRFMAVSEGSRPFTRYGYGDFLREDRPYDVVFRLWPGTQRVLLWADPAMAAGFGRQAGIGHSQGIEFFEPLTFKGREGTGLRHPRTGYADASLDPASDWEKYAYQLRLLGRLSYDPDADAEGWRRHLRACYAAGAEDAEGALSNASRILPLVTTAHHPSASNNYFWPEMYSDMPIVEGDDDEAGHPYIDTPSPRRFGTVSPLDPELFSSVAEYVSETMANQETGRYTPLDVAAWLETLADAAEGHRSRLESSNAGDEPATRRLVIDVAIQVSLGRFFAGKQRASVEYESFLRTGDGRSLRNAITHLESARAAWASAAERAEAAYVNDVTFGPQAWLRGHWRDRLPAIDADLGAMRGESRSRGGDQAASARSRPGARRRAIARHTPPEGFGHGGDVALVLEVEATGASGVHSAAIRLRPLNQAEHWDTIEMVRTDRGFAASIPGSFTTTPYSLQYFFVLRDEQGGAWLHPGLRDDLSNQPYFVVDALSGADPMTPGAG
jgi:hypothetical protein